MSGASLRLESLSFCISFRHGSRETALPLWKQPEVTIIRQYTITLFFIMLEDTSTVKRRGEAKITTLSPFK